MMRINITNPTDVALTILNLVNNSKTQYGKVTLSKMLYDNKLNLFSQEQIKDLIQQLIDQQYLKSSHIGTDFDMVVVDITDKGKEAVVGRKKIDIDLPKTYAPEFVGASEIQAIDKSIIDEYYEVKLELTKLLKKEEELKNIIKKQMIDNNIPKINTEKMDLFCKKIQRILYPKKKIEEFVPEEIREKIKEIREIIVLSARLKVK